MSRHAFLTMDPTTRRGAYELCAENVYVTGGHTHAFHTSETCTCNDPTWCDQEHVTDILDRIERRALECGVCDCVLCDLRIAYLFEDDDAS